MNQGSWALQSWNPKDAVTDVTRSSKMESATVDRGFETRDLRKDSRSGPEPERRPNVEEPEMALRTIHSVRTGRTLRKCDPNKNEADWCAIRNDTGATFEIPANIEWQIRPSPLLWHVHGSILVLPESLIIGDGNEAWNRNLRQPLPELRSDQFSAMAYWVRMSPIQAPAIAECLVSKNLSWSQNNNTGQSACRQCRRFNSCGLDINSTVADERYSHSRKQYSANASSSNRIQFAWSSKSIHAERKKVFRRQRAQFTKGFNRQWNNERIQPTAMQLGSCFLPSCDVHTKLLPIQKANASPRLRSSPWSAEESSQKHSDASISARCGIPIDRMDNSRNAVDPIVSIVSFTSAISGPRWTPWWSENISSWWDSNQITWWASNCIWFNSNASGNWFKWDYSK
jgi:hypothetical protein